MSHKYVFDKFYNMFPDKCLDVVIWFPNGRNSVRVRNTRDEEFIFTFNGQKDWRFETVDSFLNQVRKETKR